MERLSAMMQRKEQELLLQKERQAAENSGASTLELKLMIQQKLLEQKQMEQQQLKAAVAEPPQITRAKSLGLLRRRTDKVIKSNTDTNNTNTNNTNNIQIASELEKDLPPIPPPKPAQSPPAPPQPIQQSPAATPTPPSFKIEIEELLRSSSIDAFMADAQTSLPKEVEPLSPTQKSDTYKAIDHIRRESGISEESFDLISQYASNEPEAIEPPNPMPPPKPQQTINQQPSTSQQPTNQLQQQQQANQPLNQQQPTILPRKDSKVNLDNAVAPTTTPPAPVVVPQRSHSISSSINSSMPPLPTSKSSKVTLANRSDALSFQSFAKSEKTTGGDTNSDFDSIGASKLGESNIPMTVPKFSFKNSKSGGRYLVKESAAWTVATISLLKECYLFLLTDALLVTKPYERRSSHQIYFKPLALLPVSASTVVFHDVRMAKGSSSGLLQIDAETRRKIETVVSRTFESYPVKSVSYLISKDIFPRTPSAVATFLHTTPRLSKIALGKFLALENHHLILQSYMRVFQFAGIEIVPSLRMVLCCFRFPTDESEKVDIIIDAFVERWLQCNPKSLAKILPPNPMSPLAVTPSPTESSLASSPATTTASTPKHWQHAAIRQVVFGLLALDFEVHYAQSSVKVESVFLNRFLGSLLPPLQAAIKNRPDSAAISASSVSNAHREALVNMFDSIVDERLDMGEVSGDALRGHFDGSSVYWIFTVNDESASGGNDSAQQQPQISFTSTTPFLNLAVGQESPLITLRLSQPVPGLLIDVSGVDVAVVEPSGGVLDFRRTTSASFRVRATATGRKVVLFTRRFGMVGEDGQVVGDVGRGLENPAGLAMLVEPEWLKHRFCVNTAGGGGAAGVEGKSQVLAVSSEEMLGEWEEAFKVVLESANGKGVKRDSMQLKGNNPYGTLASAGSTVSSVFKKGNNIGSSFPEDGKMIELRRALFGQDGQDVQPMSRAELMRKLGCQE